MDVVYIPGGWQRGPPPLPSTMDSIGSFTMKKTATRAYCANDEIVLLKKDRCARKQANRVCGLGKRQKVRRTFEVMSRPDPSKQGYSN